MDIFEMTTKDGTQTVYGYEFEKGVYFAGLYENLPLVTDNKENFCPIGFNKFEAADWKVNPEKGFHAIFDYLKGNFRYYADGSEQRMTTKHDTNAKPTKEEYIAKWNELRIYSVWHPDTKIKPCIVEGTKSNEISLDDANRLTHSSFTVIWSEEERKTNNAGLSPNEYDYHNKELLFPPLSPKDAAQWFPCKGLNDYDIEGEAQKYFKTVRENSLKKALAKIQCYADMMSVSDFVRLMNGKETKSQHTILKMNEDGDLVSKTGTLKATFDENHRASVFIVPKELSENQKLKRKI